MSTEMEPSTDVLVSSGTEAMTSATEDPLSFYYVISERLFIWLSPVVTLVGVFGNILMLLVVQRKVLRWSPVSVFISALAVSDTLVLILDFINNWLKMALHIYVIGWHPAGCKIYRFLFTLSITYASWVVVAVSIQRAIVVWFPFRAKTLCTRHKALLTVVLMCLPLIAIFSYSFWVWDKDANGHCNIAPEFDHFQSYIAPWVVGAFYSYIPLIILIVCNAAIVIQLSRSKKQRSMMGNNSLERNKADARITRTVCVISLFYLILTAPIAIYYIVQYAAGQFIYQGPEMMLAEVVILIFGLSNHAIKLFLYICTSATFRAELVAMLTCNAEQMLGDLKLSPKWSPDFAPSRHNGRDAETTFEEIAMGPSVRK